jgi:hypothetical protein
MRASLSAEQALSVSEGGCRRLEGTLQGNGEVFWCICQTSERRAEPLFSQQYWGGSGEHKDAMDFLTAHTLTNRYMLTRPLEGTPRAQPPVKHKGSCRTGLVSAILGGCLCV